MLLHYGNTGWKKPNSLKTRLDEESLRAIGSERLSLHPPVDLNGLP